MRISKRMRSSFSAKIGGSVAITAGLLLSPLVAAAPAGADPGSPLGWRWYGNWAFSGWDTMARESCNSPLWTAYNNERLVIREGDNDAQGTNCGTFDVWQLTSTGFNVFYSVEWGGGYSPKVWTEHAWGGLGAQVDVYDALGQNNQRWRTEYPSDGSRIFHVASNQNLCIENPGASSTDGVRVKLNTCNGWNRQKFTSNTIG